MSELPTYEKSQKILNRMLKAIRFSGEAVYDMDEDRFYIEAGQSTYLKKVTVTFGKIKNIETRLKDLGYKVHSIRMSTIKTELAGTLMPELNSIASLRIYLSKRS